MLIIANGAPKSGSTWLFNIVQSIQKFAPIPEDFLLDPSNPNSEIQYDRLSEFLTTIDHSKQDYLLKNHFGGADQRDAILEANDTIVLNIKRNTKDAVVSGYHYTMKLSGEKKTFKSYYWNEGRYLADHIRRYHQTWETKPSSRVLPLSYERLKEDPLREITGIGRFIGLELSQSDAERVHGETSMEKLREKYNDDGEAKFFRKGQAGDWVNYFDPSMLKDIAIIEEMGTNSMPILQNVYAKALAKTTG